MADDIFEKPTSTRWHDCAFQQRNPNGSAVYVGVHKGASGSDSWMFSLITPIIINKTDK